MPCLSKSSPSEGAGQRSLGSGVLCTSGYLYYGRNSRTAVPGPTASEPLTTGLPSNAVRLELPLCGDPDGRDIRIIARSLAVGSEIISGAGPGICRYCYTPLWERPPSFEQNLVESTGPEYVLHFRPQKRLQPARVPDSNVLLTVFPML